MRPSHGMLVSGTNYVRGTERGYHRQGPSKGLSSGEYAVTHICVSSFQLRWTQNPTSNINISTKIHGNINLDWHLPKLNLLSCPCFGPNLLFISSFFIWVWILIKLLSAIRPFAQAREWSPSDSFLLWASAPVSMELEITLKHHSLWPLLFLQGFSGDLMSLTSPPHKC